MLRNVEPVLRCTMVEMAKAARVTNRRKMLVVSSAPHTSRSRRRIAFTLMRWNNVSSEVNKHMVSCTCQRLGVFPTKIARDA